MWLQLMAWAFQPPSDNSFSTGEEGTQDAPATLERLHVGGRRHVSTTPPFGPDIRVSTSSWGNRTLNERLLLAGATGYVLTTHAPTFRNQFSVTGNGRDDQTTTC